MYGINLSAECLHANSINMLNNIIDKYLDKEGYT